jgi:predicted DNA repair protein MutK
MSIGLLGLLDDIAGIVKVSASSIDDVAGMAAKAGLKATGAVIDDAAVTPRYVDGFAATRELPIVGKIALGSLKNKLLFLLPAALVLSFFLPSAITPLLMLGGAYLCYEGAEKVFHALAPDHAEGHEEKLTPVAMNATSREDEQVAGAIKTDFILSAEIMTIALAAIPATNFITQAFVLALVGVGITMLVYGAVALIVRLDDMGMYLARHALTGFGRKLGRGMVKAMPVIMLVLSIVGTAAMIWVGGSIVAHGLHEFGLHGPAAAIEHVHELGSHAAGPIAAWFAETAGFGLFGLALGTVLIPVASMVISPGLRALKSAFGKSH